VFATSQVLKAIRAADVITVGPGSLYTSIFAELLWPEFLSDR